MRYFIAYMLTGDAKTRTTQTSDEIASRFRLVPVSERTEPHLTLKAPFETVDVRPIETLLERFAAHERPEPMMLTGIGAFDSRIIYHKAKTPPAADMLVRRLQDILRTVPWLTFSATEFPPTLHVTLAYAKNRVQGKEILSRLTSEGIAPLRVMLDHVALLHRPQERWEVLKSYPFSGSV